MTRHRKFHFFFFFTRYGDRYPKTVIGRSIAIFWFLTGIVLSSLLVSSLTSSMSVRILDQHLHVARGKKVFHIDKNASVKKILTFILPLDVRRSCYLRALSHGKKFSFEIHTGAKAVTGWLFEDSVCFASILYILPGKKKARSRKRLLK